MRLRGKFIGGVLGACFGGPRGVALGVAIGHVCDSVSDSSESSLAARSKFLELACEGISKIAKADGRVSEGLRDAREGCGAFPPLEKFRRNSR